MVRRIFVCMVFLLVGTSCASTPPVTVNKTLSPAAESIELIARDFVSVLAQIPSLPPSGTALSVPMSDDSTGFRDSLLAELVQAGYIVLLNASADLDGMQTHIVEIGASDDATTTEYTRSGVSQDVANFQIAVGDFALKRTYAVLEGGVVKPLTQMQSRGFDSTNLVSDDLLFEGQDSSDDAGTKMLVASVEDGNFGEDAETAPNAPSVINDSDPSSARGDSASTRPESTLEIQDVPEPQVVLESQVASSESQFVTESQPLLDLPAALQGDKGTGVVAGDTPLPLRDTLNYRDLGESNYSQLFNNLRMVDYQVVEFANDSTELNSQGVKTLETIVGKYNENEDEISVIGSSHGSGAYPGAQKDLAEGRALQVQEKLTELGVSPRSVFVEASWSEEYYDEVLPRRGVVVSLWRFDDQ